MPIPHSKKIAADYADFLQDLNTSLRGFSTHAATDPDLISVFKSATACHTVFTSFSRKSPQPLLDASAGIARRIAVLAVIRQVSLMKVELRRLIECSLWYCYFVDHPVEWGEFLTNSQRGWEDRSDTPIAAAASARLGFFAAYARERMQTARVDLAIKAVETIKASYGVLSGQVHAAFGAVHASGTLALAFDSWDPKIAGMVRVEVDRVFAAVLLLCSCTNPALVGGLDAIDRSWFDWIVGKEAAKAIRSTAFGIPR